MLQRAADRISLHADWEEPPRTEYADMSAVPDPYPSVYCLPHVRESLANVFSLVPLALGGVVALGGVGKIRKSLSHLASQSLKWVESLDTVDRFYDVFQDEQWVFHETLQIPGIQAILAQVEGNKIDVREASDQMAEIYDEGMIEFGITRLKSINNLISEKETGPFLARTLLLWDARDMYLSENYRGCIHLLLACADGAVNDFYVEGESKQGLWTRAPETFVPYDTFAGHKNGLAEVLKTARQSVSKLPIRTEKERYEAMLFGQISGDMLGGMFPERHLRRNGIEHGMLINYGNKLVAAKAWNLVFAVGDWMNSVHKAREPEPEPEPQSWAELIKDTVLVIDSNQRYKKLSETHTKTELTQEHPEFTEHLLYARTKDFLECWKGSKKGEVQCRKMWKFGTKRTLPFCWEHGNDRDVKDHFEMHRIRDFQIDRINHYSYQFADVHITCHFDGYVRSEKIDKNISMTLKWTLTDEADNWPFESDSPNWYLMTWDPWRDAEIENHRT